MIAIADTHTLVWYVQDDPHLSPLARLQFEQAALEYDVIGFSSITFAEIVYLSERNRIAENAMSRLLDAVDESNSVLVEIPFDRRVAHVLPLVERAQVPELPDRIISATALYMGVPLITRDRRIRSSDVETLW